MALATDPDGVEWEVERLWAAWKVRFRLPFFAPGFDLTTLFLLVACALWFPLELALAYLAGTVLHPSTSRGGSSRPVALPRAGS